jgi:hypothetical protein
MTSLDGQEREALIVRVLQARSGGHFEAVRDQRLEKFHGDAQAILAALAARAEPKYASPDQLAPGIFPLDDSSYERIAKEFHKAYEELAPIFGYRTREESAKPWKDVPRENQMLMIATVKALIEEGIIARGCDLEAAEAALFARGDTERPDGKLRKLHRDAAYFLRLLADVLDEVRGFEVIASSEARRIATALHPEPQNTGIGVRGTEHQPDEEPDV